MNTSVKKDIQIHSDDSVYRYRVSAIHELTQYISEIVLQPVMQSLSYNAGQYVHVIQNEYSSPLSIACAPNKDKTLEFHLYHSPDNYNANELLRVAKEHKEWKLRGPFGHCTSDKLQINSPIIFLAHNTGFAPIKAVIEALKQSTAKQSIHLYWSVPRHQHFYLQSLLTKWQEESDFKFTLVIRNTSLQDYKTLHELAVMDYPKLSCAQVYASGPKPFVYAAFDCFSQYGLPRFAFYSDML